ncbi:hypothetical protein HYV79_04770 [Candidatus Woesearchaeota archaeon]|nr:hypothetical protein [Candidatus Woesearchaeota archaeon]
MAAKDKGLGPVKRFGVRYGTTTKFRFAQVEKLQKKPQQCPYCSKFQVQRISMGIFKCNKCLAKFTGQAYTVMPLVVEEVKEEELVKSKDNTEEESEGEE